MKRGLPPDKGKPANKRVLSPWKPCFWFSQKNFFSGKSGGSGPKETGWGGGRVAPRSSFLIWVRLAGGFLGLVNLVNLGIRALRDGVCGNPKLSRRQEARGPNIAQPWDPLGTLPAEFDIKGTIFDRPGTPRIHADTERKLPATVDSVRTSAAQKKSKS